MIVQLHPIMKNLHGSERTLIELTKRLANDAEPVLVHSLYIAEECRRDLEGKAHLSTPNLTLGLDGFVATALQYLLFPITIFPLACHRQKIKIVIAHAYGSILASILLARLQRCHIIYMCQEPPRFIYDLYHEYQNELPLFKRFFLVLFAPFMRAIDSLATRRADYILANSDFSRRKLQRIYRIENIIPVNLGVEKRFQSGRKEGVRMKYGLTGKVTIVSCGKLHPRKNFLLQLRLLKALLDEGLTVCLVIVGKGPQRAQLEETCKRLHLQEHVVFAGSVSEDELPDYYAVSDIFLFTAKAEPFGLVVIEAMMAGKPVVVPNDGGPAEIVTDGVNGFVYRQGDLLSLLSKIRRLIVDEKLRKTLGENAAEYAAGRTWDDFYIKAKELIDASAQPA